MPGIVLPKRRPITAWRRVGLWLLVPVVAFLVSWLLTARFFHSVPLLFLPANLLIVPLLPVYFSAGAVYVCSLLCGWDPTWLAWLLNTAFSLLSASAGAVADAGATVSQVWPRTLTVALYMSAIGGFILWLLTRTRLWWYAACALMLSSIAVPFILRPQLPADALSCVPSGGGVRITATHLEQRAVLELPSDSLSAGMLRGRRFVFADTPIAATPAGAKPLKIKWLIIGPGYEGSLARLVGAFAPDSVIFTPGWSLTGFRHCFRRPVWKRRPATAPG